MTVLNSSCVGSGFHADSSNQLLGCLEILIPLTPALSLGEREQRPPHFDESSAQGCSQRVMPFPLSLRERDRVRGKWTFEIHDAATENSEEPHSDLFRISDFGFRIWRCERLNRPT